MKLTAVCDPEARTLLLVSDDEEERFRLSRILCQLLATVVVQSCAEREAVDVAQGMPFDAVVVYRSAIGDDAAFTRDLRETTAAPIFWLSAATVENAFLVVAMAAN